MDLSKAREVSTGSSRLVDYTVDGWKPVVGEYLIPAESGAVTSQFHTPEAIEPCYSAEIVAAERRIVPR